MEAFDDELNRYLKHQEFLETEEGDEFESEEAYQEYLESQQADEDEDDD